MKAIHKHNTGTRDAALRRLVSANRWLIAGSIALTGVLSEVAAQAFPGKKLASTRTSAKHSAPPKRTPEDSSEEFHAPEIPQQEGETHPPEARSQQGSGGESSESSPRGSESAPQSSESSPPAEAPAQSAPEASSESPPVVSGGS